MTQETHPLGGSPILYSSDLQPAAIAQRVLDAWYTSEQPHGIEI